MENFSEKLNDYIARVEKDTGRRVVVIPVSAADIPGIKIAFRPHPTDITVYVTPALKQSDYEHSFAHEVTHGVLMYQRGYCCVRPKSGQTQAQRLSIEFILNSVEDIVVNKILQEEGFAPFADGYLNEVIKETRALRKGTDYYVSTFQDPLLRQRFIVYRYILLWGFLQFYSLDQYVEQTLRRFANQFRDSKPREFQVAAEIT